MQKAGMAEWKKPVSGTAKTISTGKIVSNANNLRRDQNWYLRQARG